MTIEEKPGISQENKKYYSKIEELVNHISENMEFINNVSKVTNKRSELIEMMFSYIKDEHNFDKEFYRIRVLREGSTTMNTTRVLREGSITMNTIYEHKEDYIKLLTEKIEEYVKLAKNNKNMIRRNYVESVKNNKSIKKEKLYELLNKKNLDRLGDKFVVDLEAVKKRVKDAFYSSIEEEIVQRSYVTKINNDPHLSEQARKVSRKNEKKTLLEEEALEINRKFIHSFFRKGYK